MMPWLPGTMGRRRMGGLLRSAAILSLRMAAFGFGGLSR
jgi:hypothetical protein